MQNLKNRIIITIILYMKVDRKIVQLGYWGLIILFVLFIPFDWLRYADSKWKILIIRAVIVSLTLISTFLIYRIKEKNLIYLTAALSVLASIAISLMSVVSLKGFSSNGYAGNLLVVQGICIMGIFTTTQILALISIILGSHFLLLMMVPWELNQMMPHIFFMLSFSALGVFLSNYIYKLRKAELEARQTNEYCLKVFAHDLKNKIFALGLCTQALHKRMPEETMFNQLYMDLGQMRTMVGNLINVFSCDQIKISKTRMDINKYFAKQTRNWRNIFSENSVEFVLEIEDGMTGLWDRHYMELVWDNLFSNALVHTPFGGKVQFIVSSKDNFLSFKLINSGDVISEAKQAELFSKYEASIEHSPFNKGLGLNYSMMMCKMHGGGISYKVNDNGFNEFEVILPKD